MASKYFSSPAQVSISMVGANQQLAVQTILPVTVNTQLVSEAEAKEVRLRLSRLQRSTLDTQLS